MTLNLSMPGGTAELDLRPRITVFGVGGAGGNAVNNMIQKDLEGVEFVVANTDAQALQQNQAQARIQLGVHVTEGLGAGARPQVGASAAEESIEEIVARLDGAHMCFITAGMGGGTGTGAAPIIAQAARELGILTVGVVTKPFQFEGAKRMRQAEAGVEALQKVVDTLIIIPNQNLFRLATERTTFTEAFSLADDVLYQGVKGVTDLMVRPGMINLDFADVRSVMDEMGKAMMGTGEGEGEDRAIEAAEKAIANPLLDELSLKGAKGVLINITGGYDLTLFEMDEAANRIRQEVDEDANIIVGSTLEPEMEGMMRVSVVATGIDAAASQEMPVPRRRLSEAAVPVEAPAAPAPVARQPEPEPAPAPVAARTEPEEPNFFDAAAAAAEEEEVPVEDFFSHRPSPQPEAPVYRAAAQSEPAQAAEPAASFTAPRPGSPSPETMERLRAAVLRGERSERGAEAPAAPRAAAPRTPSAPSGEHHGQRFGIGSLINRMTGSGDGAPVEPQAPKRPAAAAEPEEERIEIPAFLRRQAN
ncbi:cell division protein FtsZ [Jannaschia seohaensis]|uniref:Cell division protein FtsZ n=1 Tax=Jannaschia seohaensis TaxID=475081 RepID=A0A2Y9AA88_9RHOB|nr:cell division protein FtsZ [Jannaschia seohaensis]PWJ21074.1 cell division protein FtsZ [Jannaschia seohaensis]SSA41484.1 cell division protein FtsZ [Jannaschia seohaensis]